METLESFERKVLEKLSESKLVHKINLSNMLDDCNATSLNKLLSKAYTIKVVEDGIVFTDDNGDEIACPNFGVSIADDGRWLSSKLPDVPFDVEQGGNLRKAEEAEAAYCCCIVSLVLDDVIFVDELKTVMNNYDFSTMSALDNQQNFKDLLTEWQDLQSTTINICVSAAKYKISNVKKKKPLL